jgi:SPP1 gp7 family putative phage head morphogenesis protein
MGLFSRLRSVVAAAAGRRDVPTHSQISAAGRDRLVSLHNWFGEITPERVASALQAAEYGNVREQMALFATLEDRDGAVQSYMRDRRLAASKVPVQLLPAALPQDAPQKDRDLAEKIRDDNQALVDRVWTATARQSQYEGIGTGLSLHDIPWIVTDRGRVDVSGEGLKRIDPTALRVDETLALRILTQDNRFDGEPLTPLRYLVHVHPGRPGRPGATGLLRPCAGLVMLKRWSWEDWAIFCDLFGVPVRVGKYRSGASAQEKAALRSMLEQLGVAAWALFSEGTSVEFIESSKGGRGSLPYEPLLERVDKELLVTIKGQTGTTDLSDAHAFSASMVLAGMRQDLSEDDAGLGCDSFRTSVLVPYNGWNYGRPDLTPILKAGFEAAEDLVQTAGVITQARGVGLPLSQEYVARRLRLELPKEGETLLVSPAPALSAFPSFAGGPVAAKAGREANLAVVLAAAGDADRRAAVSVADAALAQAAKQFSFADWLDGFVSNDDSSDLADLEKMISAEIEAAAGDPPAELVDPLAQAMLLADLAGREDWARKCRIAQKAATVVAGRHGRGLSRDILVAAAGKSGASFTFQALPFEEALKLFRDKVALPKEQFDALADAAKRRAFTAAGVSSKTALEKLKAEIERALAEGRTYQQFREDLASRLEEAGLSAEQPTNLYLTFHQNVMSAYAAGQWTQIRETEGDFPYWMYVATKDTHTRPEHAALNGRIFRVGDAQAAAYFPPWDYGCRCDAIPMTAEQVEGLTVYRGADVRSEQIDLGGRVISLAPRAGFDADPIGRFSAMDQEAA